MDKMNLTFKAFENAVKGHFQEQTYEFCSVKTENKTYQVLKTVLFSVPSLEKKLVEQNKESDGNSLKVPEDCTTIEIMLAYMHGARYKDYITETFRPTPTFEAPSTVVYRRKGSDVSVKISSKEYFTPSREVLSKAINQDPNAKRDVRRYKRNVSPSAQLSLHFCKEFTLHFKVYVAAKKYEMKNLMCDAEGYIITVLHDCWSCDEILRIICIEVLPLLGDNDGLSYRIARALGLRMDIFTDRQMFHDIVEDNPKFARDMLLEALMDRSPFTTAKRMFCTHCQRNVESIADKCRWCGGDLYLSPPPLMIEREFSDDGVFNGDEDEDD